MKDAPPPVTSHGVTPIFNVQDFAKSIQYYEDVLLFHVDWKWGEPPSFGSVSLDQASIFLCEQGQGASGTWISLFIDDVDAYHDLISKRGAKITQKPQDEPWGCREMHVRDLDGHVIRFTHTIPEKEPKMEIERVDFPTRIETRLAAVIEDLAKHKDMTVNEVLEETFLHTFERVGKAGVASPHTERTLNHIEELKKKHGIDYDAHASYRFVEKE